MSQTEGVNTVRESNKCFAFGAGAAIGALAAGYAWYRAGSEGNASLFPMICLYLTFASALANAIGISLPAHFGRQTPHIANSLEGVPTSKCLLSGQPDPQLVLVVLVALPLLLITAALCALGIIR